MTIGVRPIAPVGFVVTALALAACTGDDASVPPTSPDSAPGPVPSSTDSGALVPIDPVTPATAAPTTTNPPELPDRLADPNPDWAPVAIPSGEPLQPSAFGSLADDPASQLYDIAPDGRSLARLDAAGTLCLTSTADNTSEVCDGSIEASFVEWAPDGSGVLFNFFSAPQGRAGPLGTFALDGSVTTLVEPSGGGLFGGAYAAGFVDAATVMYTRIVAEPATVLEVHTIAIDGSDDRLLGSLELGSPPNDFLPLHELVDGTSLYLGVTTRAPGANGVWRFDPDTDRFGRIIGDGATEVPGAFVGHAPVAVRGGLLLTVESVRLAASASNQDDARFFDLMTIDGATSVSIDDVDDEYMILSAALSPDGAHVAVYEFYRGDDRTIADSAAVGRVSITTSASLFAGDAVWFTIGDVGPGTSARNLDRSGTVLTWPTTDRLHVELLEGAYAVDVTAA